MKNPTSRTANRVIDVIFVHPKHRSYVIWHDGVFYQLTRMNLTQKAWDRRTVYDGLLDEIFVAKESCEQGETDERAWQELGLNVVKLPMSYTALPPVSFWLGGRSIVTAFGMSKMPEMLVTRTCKISLSQ